MLNQLSSLIQWMQENATGFRNFLGEYTSGNAVQYGPFLGVAPEAAVCVPYVVFEVLTQGMDQGFGGLGASYGEKPIIRFHLYDDDADSLAANLETFTSTLDVVSPAMVGCNTVIRKDNPQLLHEPVGKKGQRIYHAMAVYEFWTSRIKGT